MSVKQIISTFTSTNILIFVVLSNTFWLINPSSSIKFLLQFGILKLVLKRHAFPSHSYHILCSGCKLELLNTRLFSELTRISPAFLVILFSFLSNGPQILLLCLAYWLDDLNISILISLNIIFSNPIFWILFWLHYILIVVSYHYVHTWAAILDFIASKQIPAFQCSLLSHTRVLWFKWIFDLWIKKDFRFY